MRTKQAAAGVHLKAFNATEGTFEALVSVFGVVDRVGDRVMPGAFTATLARWAASGDPVPCIWAHDWDNPEAHIGVVLDAEERSAGLWAKCRLDIDRPFAAKVYDLLAGRRIREFSFAYDVIRERRAADGANELLELDLIEVGPCLKGVNPDTSLLATKSRSSRLLSPKSELAYIAALEAAWAQQAPTLTPAGVLYAARQMER